jgi:hypothetical protein
VSRNEQIARQIRPCEISTHTFLNICRT